jgi:hypothetical protein
VIAFAIVLLAVLTNRTTRISNWQIGPTEALVVLTILNTNTVVNLGLLTLGVGISRATESAIS